jgi:hypothetical protein
MQQVLAEVQAVGTLDPAAQQRLLADLQATSPDLWPLVARQFRAALAYREQTQREQPKPSGTQLASHVDRGAPSQAVPAKASPAYGRDTSPRAQAAPGGTPSSLPIPPSREPDKPATQPAGLAAPADAPAGATTPQPPDPSPTRAASAYRQAIGTGSDNDWQAAVAEAIAALDASLSDSPDSEAELAQHARLRMLCLAAGHRDRALSPIPAAPPSTQDFWLNELHGLDTLLGVGQIPDASRRTAAARQRLDEALARLREAAPLVVRNLAFVTEVQSFGSYKPFPKYEFTPGQKVLLYAEVENFKSTQTEKGHHTALKSSYQIFDSRGQRVAEHDFPTNEEYCRNPRRDYFMGYEFSMPKRIYAGRHVLQLTVVDQQSQKIGQSSIEFTIRADEE